MEYINANCAQSSVKMKFSWFTSILGLLWASQYSVQQCGKVSEAQHYNGKSAASINEFPWLGRVLFQNSEEKLYFRCVAVLITKRHLLTVDHCFRRVVVDSILLGDFDYGNDDSEQDCDTKNNCAPPPQKYTIQDIIYHPNYNLLKRLNDIAIIRLEKNVIFNDYVQPICLPPPTIYTTDLLGDYFPIAGFITRNRFEEITSSTKIMKTVAHVISNERCSNTFRNQTRRSPVLNSSIICASYIGDYVFVGGSVLMGINIEKSKVNNYYLIGILSYGGYNTEDGDNVQYDGFVKISSYVNWIESNINHEY